MNTDKEQLQFEVKYDKGTTTVYVEELFNNCWGLASLDYFHGCVVKTPENKFVAYFGSDETSLDRFDPGWFSKNSMNSFKDAAKELLLETMEITDSSIKEPTVKTVSVNVAQTKFPQ